MSDKILDMGGNFFLRLKFPKEHLTFEKVGKYITLQNPAQVNPVNPINYSVYMKIAISVSSNKREKC